LPGFSGFVSFALGAWTPLHIGPWQIRLFYIKEQIHPIFALLSVEVVLADQLPETLRGSLIFSRENGALVSFLHTVIPDPPFSDAFCSRPQDIFPMKFVPSLVSFMRQQRVKLDKFRDACIILIRFF